MSEKSEYNAESVAGSRSTCTRCGRAIWLSEFRPGEAAEGHGVWLSGPMSSDCACVHDLDTGEFLPHVPAVRADLIE